MRRFDEALALLPGGDSLRPVTPTPGAAAPARCANWGASRVLAAAERALSCGPFFAEAAINLGNALLKLDRMEEALAAYRRAGAPRARFARGPVRRGLGVAHLGRFEEAMAAFEAAEALGSREAIAGKGCLCLRSATSNAASRDTKRAGLTASLSPRRSAFDFRPGGRPGGRASACWC